MITTQTADNVLKSYYLPAISDQLNTEANPLLAMIKQSTQDVWGKDVRKLVRYGVNGGIGAGTEDGALPTAKGNNYVQFVSTLKNLYGTIEISDKAIRASQNNEGAFVNLLNDEMDGLMKSASFNFGRMLYGTGIGVLGTVSAVSGGVFTVDKTTSFAEGMLVDFYAANGNMLCEGKTVTKVDIKEKKVTVDDKTLTATAVPVGSQICLHGCRGHEITGLGALFSTTNDTLYGVDKTKYSFMTPYRNELNGKISEDAIQKAIDAIEEASGSRVNFIVCSWGVRRALVKELTAKNYAVNTVDLKGGYRAISFNGIPVYADRFCPEGSMYLLNTNDFCLHQLCDWQWLEGEDGKILKQIPGKPVYTATLVKYAELMCFRPCGQGIIVGITEE